ncbi:hypothetical protein CKAH01_01731 [Colletotrichum kahawae]|uniref:Uncharacterized protein n=1 Tax=Colletotrichum kahawae TaxID=34407 RepID=A0AAD9Y4Z7_COLKA|nr:hypothetical protein CKAH01_01731 [Colletotrichum kahawae]
MRRGGNSRLICLLAVQSPASTKKKKKKKIAFSLGLVSERPNERTKAKLSTRRGRGVACSGGSQAVARNQGRAN